MMPHFLLTVRKKLAPEALHDAAVTAIQQGYRQKARITGDDLNLAYVIAQAGGVWYAKHYHDQSADPFWYRRPNTNFEAARSKAIQETLHAFVPPEHRQRLRFVTDPEAILNVVRESLMEQIGSVLMRPTSSYDPNSLDHDWTAISTCAQRLEAFPLLAQAVSQQFPFSPILRASELYPAYDLSDGRQAGPTDEDAIAHAA
jgi:hypothetical protein